MWMNSKLPPAQGSHFHSRCRAMLIGATSQEPIESSRAQCVLHGNARQKKEVFDQDAHQSCGDSSILSLKQRHRVRSL